MVDKCNKFIKFVRRKTVKSKLDNKIDTLKNETLENALKEVIQEDIAGTKINRVIKGHLGRKDYKFEKEYPQRAKARQEQVNSNLPSDDLTRKPEKNAGLAPFYENIQKRKKLYKEKYDQALKENHMFKDLQKTTQHDKAANKLQNAFRNHRAQNELIDRAANRITENHAAQTIQNQFRNHRAINEAMNRAENKIIQQQNKAATKLQNVVRSHQAKKEVRNKILTQSSNENSAARTIQSALKNRRARKELTQNREQFNPIDYQDRIRANKKTFQNQVSDYSERRPQPLKEHQAKKLRIAKKHIESINELTEQRKQTGRPPGPSSRAISRLSSASTIQPSSPAAFTPKPKKK